MLYEFLMILFGVTNSLFVFIEHMNWVFNSYIGKFVVIFIDDILIYSRTPQEQKTILGLYCQSYEKIDFCKVQQMWVLDARSKFS